MFVGRSSPAMVPEACSDVSTRGRSRPGAGGGAGVLGRSGAPAPGSAAGGRARCRGPGRSQWQIFSSSGASFVLLHSQCSSDAWYGAAMTDSRAAICGDGACRAAGRLTSEERGEGVWDPKGCAPKMAQQDFSQRQISFFFPQWSLWPFGGGGSKSGCGPF